MPNSTLRAAADTQFIVQMASRTPPPDVWLQPDHVWEVKGSELSRSPMHTAGRSHPGESDKKGYSLRFPRLVRPRPDKTPAMATTVDEILDMMRGWAKDAGDGEDERDAGNK